jgi:ribosomal protein L2
VAQWLCHTTAVPPETLGSRPGSVVTGRSVGRYTIGLVLSGLWRGWPVGDILVSLRTSNPCGRLGAVCTNHGSQVHGFSSNTLVRLGSGWMRAVLRSSVAWLGCVSEDVPTISTFQPLSLATTGVVAMRQDGSD